MKPSAQSNKAGSSNLKSKKSLKDREKRKSQGGSSDVNNHNTGEKGSPTKESNTRLYAGIDADSLKNYAEQTAIEHLSDEVSNILTEDINYKLRYIINDSLIKARLSGRNAISCNDLEPTFENLRIERVFGAPSNPNWLVFNDQNLYCLEDQQISLVDLAESENVYFQYHETEISKKWMPEQKEVGKPLKNYFTSMCQIIVGSEIEVRKMALTNIGENPRIGPITEWFYNFGYILLSKDITYDSLTLRALDLIRVLENSPLCRINVSEKQLKLLVRLILQRLLKSSTTEDVLRPLCNVLALLCQRGPLKEFVVLKICQKMAEVFDIYALPVLTIVNSLGVDAIKAIFLPNLYLFLKRIEKNDLAYNYSILESYSILCKERLLDLDFYEAFVGHFGDAMIVFNENYNTKCELVRKEINFAHVKCDLLKTRRKISPREKVRSLLTIEDIFDMPEENSKVRKKIEEQKFDSSTRNNDSVIVGKTSLLLPVFRKKVKNYGICQNHTLWYNL